MQAFAPVGRWDAQNAAFFLYAHVAGARHTIVTAILNIMKNITFRKRGCL